MRQFALLTLILVCTVWTANAQTFTQHVQQQGQNGKTVTIRQSKEIDELVNHTDVSRDTKPTTTNPKTESARKPSQTSAAKDKTTTVAKKSNPTGHQEIPTSAAKHDTSTAEKSHTGNQTDDDGDGMDIPTVDMRKKVMRRSYKVNGYRVQVYAGGNSRTDKQKAQKAGDSVKMAFPDIPVYVHFYSPRWICRIGNFRTYEEANSVLKQVRDLGYKQACIVSGKITVAY